MKRTVSFLTPTLRGVLICVWCTTSFAQNFTPIDLTQARAAFAQAQAMSNEEGGHLWGKPLYGSLFFVDPETRAVVSNEPDPDGVLRAADGLYVGTLPKNVIISNAPTEWEGKRWTMLIWPTVPADILSRRIMFGHELFHRIQPDLGLDAPDSANLQLDSPDGRLWLQLEWRALAAALVQAGDAQLTAMRDAIAFRNYRQHLFPGSATAEANLEIAEGVPEYTGVMAGEPDRHSARWRAVAKLVDPDVTTSFVRSFAYTSGPPYGLLLDDRMAAWRTKLTAKSDLGLLLASTLRPGAAVSATTRSEYYGATSIRLAEVERDHQVQTARARYRARLVDGPTLLLPGGHRFAYSFNPSTLVSLGAAETVYPTFHATDEWGVLDVTDGVLVPTDFSRATVTAPGIPEGTHLEGPGWTLDLAPGWKLVPADKVGSFTVKKE